MLPDDEACIASGHPCGMVVPDCTLRPPLALQLDVHSAKAVIHARESTSKQGGMRAEACAMVYAGHRRSLHAG